MRIGERAISPDEAVYVIAEIGVNHDGDPWRAQELVRAAGEAGADAVKFQYFETDRLMSAGAKLAAYQSAAGETDPIAMLRRLELSLDDLARAVDLAHGLGLHAILTVFSTELVGPASRLAWDAFKSASPDVIHRPLLEAMAGTGRPLIVSTGASTPPEVNGAADWLREYPDVAFLHCVSSYPAPDPALGGIAAVAKITGRATGYSDHTESVQTGALAVSAGALLLERHLTYDRSAAGPDHAASLEARDFARYAHLAREARTGINETRFKPDKRVLACERDVRRVSRQSVVAARDLAPGEVLGEADLTCKRPGEGIAPHRLPELIGRMVTRAVGADTALKPGDVEGFGSG
ncbi:MAG: N-acetylneuraminate synthase family protein [Phycisphaerales bacterium JB040]